jgi:hypothetical protein
MDESLSKLHTYLSQVLAEASIKFKFIDHGNHNSNRSIDNLFESDACSEISKVITCKDLIYFTCIQSSYNLSYARTNRFMTDEDHTNVTNSAYKKQRQRKPFELYEFIYRKLFEFYDDLVTGKRLPGRPNTKIAIVDGSHYTLNKSLCKDGIKLNQAQKTTSLTTTAILDYGTKLPVHVIENVNNNEIQGFVDELTLITSKYIFIFDRLYICKKYN